MNKFFLFSFLVVCIVGFGCVSDVSHDNSLDPLSPSYKAEATIGGRVTIRNLASVGIGSAFVIALPANISTRTDSNGYFSLSKIPSGNCTLIVQKENFIADTLQISVTVNVPQTVSFSLKAEAVLNGRVIVRNLASVGIGSALVTLLPLNIATRTDANGYFAFSTKIATGNYTLTVQKENFVTDTLQLSFKVDEQQTISFLLNGFPVITSSQVITQKIDQYFPGPIYSATFTATVADPNGDVDITSVWLSVDTLRFPMLYVVTENKFQVIILPENLPSNTIEVLIGKNMYIAAKDTQQVVGKSAPITVTRIIETGATPLYPKYTDSTVTSTPEFKWSAPSVSFNFTYTITVVRQESGTETIKWSKEKLGSYLVSYPYPNVSPLQKGNYFWTISIVDEYGNISRSKQSPFIVN